MESEQECERLDQIRRELEGERAKFTEAAVKLGKEKMALEVRVLAVVHLVPFNIVQNERIKFLEERRIWQEQQFAKPCTPPPLDIDLVPDVSTEFSPKKSIRKSPRKQKVVGKLANGRKTRASRRSSIFSILPPARIEPAYETELIPIHVPPSTSSTQELRKSILPTSFVLPPPSPSTSLPPPPNTLLEALQNTPTHNTTEPSSSSQTTSSDPTFVDKPALSQNAELALPQTPPVGNRPFPMAKPLASRMTHAYSPVKPSPLSRILMLASSPESPELRPLQTLGEAEAALANRLAPMQRLSKTKTKTHSRPSEPPASKAKANGSIEKENRGKSTRAISPGTTSQTKVANATKAEPLVKATTSKAPPKPSAGRGGARRVLVGSAEAAPGWKG